MGELSVITTSLVLDSPICPAMEYPLLLISHWTISRHVNFCPTVQNYSAKQSLFPPCLHADKETTHICWYFPVFPSSPFSIMFMQAISIYNKHLSAKPLIFQQISTASGGMQELSFSLFTFGSTLTSFACIDFSTATPLLLILLLLEPHCKGQISGYTTKWLRNYRKYNIWWSFWLI